MSKPPIFDAFDKLQAELRLCSASHHSADLTLPAATYDGMARILAGYARSGEIAALDVSSGVFKWDNLTIRRGK